jgi:hypothetical protein
MKSIENLVGIGKIELLQLYGLEKESMQPKRDGRSYLELPSLGISFVLSDDDKVTTVHLYSDNRDDYLQFVGAMPFGLSFSMSQNSVFLLLGKPQRAIQDELDPLLGKMMARDIYVIGSYSVSVEYASLKQEISLISIS